MFSTTEITSHEIGSDNVIHQRLLYAYLQAAERVEGNLLEIGCGAGRGMEAIAKACQSYTGIDKNTALLAQHRLQYPRFTFLEMNVPPFQGMASNSFDFVISFQVIEHIENDRLFLEEIHRVLKPGGKAIITTPNIELSLTRNPWHVREYTAKQLEALMKPIFEDVSLYGVCGSPRVMEYYERNKASVARIAKLDIFDLQHRLPRTWLQIPYEMLNRMNRKKLMEKGEGLVASISATEDYHLDMAAEKGFDFFCVVRK